MAVLMKEGQHEDVPKLEDEKYFMEKDTKEAAEVERLTYQHEVIKSFMGSLVLAPVDLTTPGLRILDSATADGLWLRDLNAITSAKHTYVGTDITESYFPDASTLPKNISLHIQSITKPWPEQWNGTFDLVHQRFALPAAGKDGIDNAVKNLIQLVKPGGWIQLIDADHSIYTGPAMGDMWLVMKEIFGQMNLQDDLAKNVKSWLVANQLEDVHERILDVPLGAKNPDPELARKSAQSFILGARGVVGATKMMKTSFSTEFLEQLVPRIEEELKNEGGVSRAYAIWGRRPLI